MKSIKEIDIANKRVFIRVDFNVPMDEQQNIIEDTRIQAVLPTLRYALDNQAKLIIASHMGRPKGKKLPELSLKPIAKRLGRLLGKDVKMANDCIGPDVKSRISAMKAGDIVLLENLRFHREEQKNNDQFARELASLCDVYVNDAFAVSHRVHASVVAVTKYAPVSVAGFLLQKEIGYFSKIMADPQHPVVAIIGGVKVSDKLMALDNMLDHVDKFIIGGAMANTFLKSKGYDVGKSKIEENLIEAAGSIMKKAAKRKIKFYLPVDAVVARRFDPKAQTKLVPIQEIPENWMALDIGPATSLLFSEVLYDAKTVIWNGPMGALEIDSFSRGTTAMVHSVANCYALTIVGGGETDVAIHNEKADDRITYISTGGGAFLTMLEGKTLPALTALEDSEKKHDNL
ncbi:MAG: phosphoglycerate kinase [Thermodesulfobacteriota bacterium]|nr:phosphoglycerate kinase [Thermodesulfobacteriota bacterium]